MAIRRSGPALQELARELEAVGDGHAGVDEGDVGRGGVQRLQRGLGALGLGGHLDARRLRQHEADQEAGIGCVVDDHDAYGVHPARDLTP